MFSYTTIQEIIRIIKKYDANGYGKFLFAFFYLLVNYIHSSYKIHLLKGEICEEEIKELVKDVKLSESAARYAGIGGVWFDLI